MKIAFYGSSLLSSYWNGAATYYRGLLRALAARGYDITFYEPDAFGRQQHRDIEPPDWCRVVVYQASRAALRDAASKAAAADIVVKASGVGYEDDALLESLLRTAREDALTIFWDVDAPATLAELTSDPRHPLRRVLGQLDLVLTYGGGEPVASAYRTFGAAACVPIYNGLDRTTHHPVPRSLKFGGSLAFLGNRLPDREARVEEFLLGPAAALPRDRFILGGSGWQERPLPRNVKAVGHVPTSAHNAFNLACKAVLNINRESMAKIGFSPPTRIFEAAGAGACVITDHWPGLEQFFEPGLEILTARDGADIRELLVELTQQRAAEIGAAALERVLRDHSYEQRADAVDRILRETAAAKLSEAAA